VLQRLGPGLLFAAAAVGVSHLVQSTRAGALYGLGMLGIIVLANVTKYPAFRYAPAYTADTGYTLVESFRRQGRWALGIFTVVFLVGMFVSQAAITLVSAALLQAGLGLELPTRYLALGLLLVTALILYFGRYHLLDRLIKVLMVILFACTLIAAALAVPLIDWGGAVWLPADASLPTIMFIAALAGWMPAPLDVVVMQSLWTVAKSGDEKRRISAGESRFDFHVGFFGSMLLAICFMLLGAGVMHGSGERFATSAAGFAAQVIRLYTSTLGDWSWPVVATAAFATMYSTVITAMDGYARVLPAILARWRRAEIQGENAGSGRAYNWALALVVLGAAGVVTFLLSSFKLLVTVATTVAFLTAPFIAWLVHRAINSAEVAEAVRPQGAMYLWSWVCVAALVAFAAGYLYLMLAA